MGLVQVARIGQAETGGAIEGALAHPDGVASRRHLRYTCSTKSRVEWVEARACGPGILLAGRGGRETRSSHCSAGRARCSARRGADIRPGPVSSAHMAVVPIKQ
jgi:hypothetical protein